MTKEKKMIDERGLINVHRLSFAAMYFVQGQIIQPWDYILSLSSMFIAVNRIID